MVRGDAAVVPKCELAARADGMIDRPLVSIVTPTRNQGAYIEQTIRSIKTQTYPRIEHIVVDGGSTDDTHDILRKHDGTYDLRWSSEPDGGMYEALNRGFATATGDVLAYLNSDDLYFPWSVEAAVAGLGRGADLVYGDAMLIDDSSGALRPHFQLPFRRRFLMTIGSFAQPATWWRRSVRDAVGPFDESLKSVADLDFFIRATAVARVRKIDEFLALMRIHPGMQTIAAAPRLAAENRLVRDRYLPRDARGRAVVVGERARAWTGRRLAWARFVGAAAGRGGGDRAWGRFLEESVRLDYPRILAGQLPMLGPRLLPGAVVSVRDWRTGGAA